MPFLKPGQWLAHAHLVTLPVLAALFVQRPLGEPAREGFDAGVMLLRLSHHGFWLLVALAVGCWVGWWTAVDRPAPETLADEASETGGEAAP